jgi:hypothetical protein
MRTLPVNQSAGPLPEGWLPARLISMSDLLSLWVCPKAGRLDKDIEGAGLGD